MPSTSARVPHRRAARRTATPVAGVAAGLAALLVTGPAAPAAVLPATVPTAAQAVVGAGWADQVGVTPLAPVIRAAGADKADKRSPDDGAAPAGGVLTGAGVGVALVDSGVAPVPGLTGTGKIIHGPDLSFESQAPNLRHLDTYGHGTHMAGIIAGQDPATTPAGGRFDGVAPGAHLVSLKVAATDGATDVSQVVAAIDWVIEHRNDPGFNIRVLNLSYGTRSRQAATLDPLSYAVERAWRSGIVVVVAGGNDGFTANTLTMPAVNPDVLAVGAADPLGTYSRADDVVADFSNRGNRARHPDVLAAGRSVVSLRVPGSYLDRTYPGARLSASADPGQRFFRGSGTSQAAAVVAGSVALLLQQRPHLTPDQVKQLLRSTATPIVRGDAWAAGSGQVDVLKAAGTRTPAAGPQVNLASTGLGSLEAARGGSYVYDPASGTPLTGERDIFGRPWSPPSWVSLSQQGRAWSGGTWNGSVWTGARMGPLLNGARTWTPTTWTGRTWSGTSWSGRTWSGAQWTGRTWSASTFTGRTWSGRTWSSAAWPEVPWQ